MDWLYHERNILGKIRSNYKGRRNDFQSFYDNYYIVYKKNQLAIKGVSMPEIREKVKLINGYLKDLDNFNVGNWITQQSKFRPTVFEEFLGFLFKDDINVLRLGLGFYNKQIYAGISIGPGGIPKIKTKDVDFCIAKELYALFERVKYIIRIPIVAIEAKTYIDKTMFNEAQFTAEIIKRGTPNVKVYVFAGRNEIGLDQIPPASPLDEVFIVSGDGEIDADTVFDFFSEVTNGLSKVKEEVIVELPGRLLNPG